MELKLLLVQRQLPQVGAATTEDNETFSFIQQIAEAVNFARSFDKGMAQIVVARYSHESLEYLTAWAKAITDALQVEGEKLIVGAVAIDVEWEDKEKGLCGKTGEMAKITITSK